MARTTLGELTLGLANADDLVARTRPPRSSEVTVTIGAAIGARYFVDCPVCGAPATPNEHIPPKAVGGHELTSTCGPCNNVYGGRFEPHLENWLDRAISAPSFSAEGVRGYRTGARLLIRNNARGEFVLIPDGRPPNDLDAILASGFATLTLRPPDEDFYRIALLKHAFLAASMSWGYLIGEIADGIRAELLAARDAPTLADVPVSGYARDLLILRRSGSLDRIPAPVMHATARMATGDRRGVMLAGRVFVSWPFTRSNDTTRRTPARIEATLTIGKAMQGVVRSVDRAIPTYRAAREASSG